MVEFNEKSPVRAGQGLRVCIGRTVRALHPQPCPHFAAAVNVDGHKAREVRHCRRSVRWSPGMSTGRP